MSAPGNILQFRNPPRPDVDRVYMDGTTIGCGDHPSTPPRHWWARWEYKAVKATGSKYRERMCRRCGRWTDPEWLDDDGEAA